MRVPQGYKIKNQIGLFRAGAIYIEVQNLSTTETIYILFDGVDFLNAVTVGPSDKKTFPLLGSQGYVAFSITNFKGSSVENIFVVIIN